MVPSYAKFGRINTFRISGRFFPAISCNFEFEDLSTFPTLIEHLFLYLFIVWDFPFEGIYIETIFTIDYLRFTLSKSEENACDYSDIKCGG